MNILELIFQEDSKDQEYSRTGISYEEAMPGDLILYDGTCMHI